MNKNNPWKTISQSVVYENPWIKVQEDQVIRPDGLDGIYGVVNFKNKAVGVLPIDEEGFTYLVGQYRYPLGFYSWEIPEGGCPQDAQGAEGEEGPHAACDHGLRTSGCHRLY